ncbi:MAG: DUF5719 family protein [Actinomycetota bacterium]|jgi:hypothetical protein|nr:DUF5719 family protein [Actinomycetota bacterium]
MAEPWHRRRSAVPRLPALAALGAVLVVGVVAGRPTKDASAPAPPAASGATAAPPAALSSSWFCAGATDVPHGPAGGRLVLTNAGSRALRAEVTIVPSAGASSGLSVQVPAGGRAEVPESVPGGAAWVGAIVAFDGGQATVEQEVSGPLGAAISPCATAGSPTWYFAAGATLLNADSTISLLNPYPAPAIVNLSFTTDQGQEAPGAFQGLVVPPHGLLAVPLRSHLRRRSFIATTVQASAGEVVAWKTDVVARPPKGAPLVGSRAAAAPLADPASPFVGVTTLPGAPQPSTSWMWPDGGTGPGTNEAFELYNPGSTTARVLLSVRLDQGTAEPFALTVGPGQVTTLDTSASARIPSGAAYAVRLQSTNGVPVVAERVVTAASPAAGRGTAELLGATTASRSWLIGSDAAGAARHEILTVAAASGRPVVVRVSQLVGNRRVTLPGLGAVTVGGPGPLVVDLGRLGVPVTAPLLVTATAPVVVARQLVAAGRPGGLTGSLAVPLAP